MLLNEIGENVLSWSCDAALLRGVSSGYGVSAAEARGQTVKYRGTGGNVQRVKHGKTIKW